MVKAALAPTAPAPTEPGIYSATYSGIPVYEFQFGADLKEHVMRRRQDDWINATHILKAAGFDKPARTRILEREVQKDTHEKIQGGYGKYQGTWIPLDSGEQLAQRNGIFETLRPIFEYVPGNVSPPPAPRHTSKPKAPKKPAVPKWAPAIRDDYETASLQPDDDIPDNATVASVSNMADDDRHDGAHYSTGQRKRKREETQEDLIDQQHAVYGDELLDYFLLTRNDGPAFRPEPPPNFQPDRTVDNEKHTPLHWACAMGDIDVMRQLRRYVASVGARNCRGETPLMRTVNFTNCYDKKTFPAVIRELWDTIDARDDSGYTVLHHAAVMKGGRATNPSCSRYYLDILLNRLQETHHPAFVAQLLDAQDCNGNTALHLAAKSEARKCIRALLGRGVSTSLVNHVGERAEDLIRDLNAKKAAKDRLTQRSSSPFAPESQRQVKFRDALTNSVNKMTVLHHSEAAKAMQSKITPLVLDKFQELAQSYEDELKEKTEAEAEAKRMLGNTQNELAIIRQRAAEIESRLESEEAAAKAAADASTVQHQVHALLTQQCKYHIQASVEHALALANGTKAEADTPEERLGLARELRQLLAEQEQAESEYVKARGLSGTGETIGKYRRLLKRCLDRDDAENLDLHLDDLIEMMEEERMGSAVVSGLEPGLDTRMVR